MQLIRSFVAIVCCLSLLPSEAVWAGAWQEGQAPAPQDAAAQDAAAKLTPDQLDSLVAPIALYPDPLLSQALVASTYPLEVIQLQQWLDAHKDLKDKALTDAVMKQGWDPSVQAMAVVPDMAKRLSGDIKWTTDLGNAFLAQQSDVMAAVQRMRAKAKEKGTLASNEQQKVETQVIENKNVIVIQPSSPEVVYVPSYNPTVVYGPPVYPYPPVYYPPPPPPGAYIATAAISFGVGMMVGAAWGGGGWGCGWGNNDVNINVNNNFVRNSNTNIQGGNRNRVNAQGGNTWQHNPQHRGGAPYSNRSTANRYGGTARGDSPRANAGGGNRSLPEPWSRRSGRRRSGRAIAVAHPRREPWIRNGAGGGDRGGNRGSSPSARNYGSWRRRRWRQGWSPQCPKIQLRQRFRWGQRRVGSCQQLAWIIEYGRRRPFGRGTTQVADYDRYRVYDPERIEGDETHSAYAWIDHSGFGSLLRAGTG
jgi:hypothetical protein